MCPETWVTRFWIFRRAADGGQRKKTLTPREGEILAFMAAGGQEIGKFTVEARNPRVHGGRLSLQGDCEPDIHIPRNGENPYQAHLRETRRQDEASGNPKGRRPPIAGRPLRQWPDSSHPRAVRQAPLCPPIRKITQKSPEYVISWTVRFWQRHWRQTIEGDGCRHIKPKGEET
jgi:hypothetical protein